MKFLVIETYAETASFRNPDFQNFHKTLLLPSPTAIVGLAGAAMGFSPKKAQEYFFDNEIKIGVYGNSLGIVKDLWKYRDLSGKRSVLKKEILFKNNFIIMFISDMEKAIEEIKEGFMNPHYALTMGNSDSLALIKNIVVEEISDMVERDYLENCLVEGDIFSEVVKNIDNGLEISIYNTSEPIAYDLPVKFYYEKYYGTRYIIERKPFSFLTKGRKVKINTYKKGIKYKDIFIPACSL
jgi:CRISPR-associated protein Cas5t